MANDSANVIIDYYVLFNLDRSQDEKALRKALREKDKLWSGRQQTAKDTQIKMDIDSTLKKIADAIKALTFPEKRKLYDQRLDEAYKNGLINDREQAEAKDALERARRYYEEGKLELAIKSANEAISGGVNNPDAYQILCESYYQNGDYDLSVETLKKANAIYKENEDFIWLLIRYNIQLERYEYAQNLINEQLSINSKNSLVNSEQVYLYLYAEKIENAMLEIDSYTEKNPDDIDYKRYVAYNLISFARTFYLYDSRADAYVIIDEKGYNSCLKYVQKAYDMYQDEYTKAELDSALFFGQKEYNKEYKFDIVFYVVLSAISLIAALSFFPIILLTVLFALIAFAIYKLSIRPFWQTNKCLYTGVTQDGILLEILTLFPEAIKDFVT